MRLSISSCAHYLSLYLWISVYTNMLQYLGGGTISSPINFKLYAFSSIQALYQKYDLKIFLTHVLNVSLFYGMFKVNFYNSDNI